MKFSIITVSYNAAEYIEETMRSVLNQDYLNIEYIVVDGGSKDGTLSIVEKLIPEFEKKGIEVKFSSEPDKGISDAFNKGIIKSTGDVIALINAGDGLLPDTLRKVAEVWTDKDEIIYGKTLSVDKQNNMRYLRKIPDGLDLSKMKYNGLVFTHQSAFVKKDVYDRWGIYDVNIKYIMDSFLFMHFYNNGVRFRYIDEVLVYMLYGGISSSASKGMLEERIKFSEKYNGYSKGKIIFKYYMDKPKKLCKNIIRRYPKLWNKMLGDDRQVGDDEYRW